MGGVSGREESKVTPRCQASVTEKMAVPLAVIENFRREEDLGVKGRDNYLLRMC